MNARRHTKFVREGSYAAEVDVELIEEENGWSPYLSLDDARKLDDVREALRRGGLQAASPPGRGVCFPPLPRLNARRTNASNRRRRAAPPIRSRRPQRIASPWRSAT